MKRGLLFVLFAGIAIAAVVAKPRLDQEARYLAKRATGGHGEAERRAAKEGKKSLEEIGLGEDPAIFILHPDSQELWKQVVLFDTLSRRAYWVSVISAALALACILWPGRRSERMSQSRGECRGSDWIGGQS